MARYSTPPLWTCCDRFVRAWNPLTGDFILQARVVLRPGGGAAHRRHGWLVRTSLAEDAPFVEACLHDDGRCTLVFRRIQGSASEQRELPLSGADVLKLERRASTLVFSCALTGSPLVSMEVSSVDLGDEVLVGLFDCGGTSNAGPDADFRDVRVSRPPKPGYIPYTDYIGARLEILNVFTGELEQVHGSAEQFEAPNWMPDGRTIIYNISGPGPAKGTLRTFDLLTRKEAPLDTGFAICNNNDHVLSFDGTQLAISHHCAEDGGKSVIYTLPSRGGNPRRITPKSPSYLHGWSPDAKWLVYTGGRVQAPGEPEKYDIYKIPSEGGEELRLTASPGLSDGPEFSPDGQWIYFNSTRSGLMQLWRMRPDGSQQERLTHDECNNWFPHLSPDGRWLVFISYGQDVRPDEHPYYKHCTLRLMPADGGDARIIAYLFGGQGSINVPSWSPDGTRIAFVSNTD